MGEIPNFGNWELSSVLPHQLLSACEGTNPHLATRPDCSAITKQLTSSSYALLDPSYQHADRPYHNKYSDSTSLSFFALFRDVSVLESLYSFLMVSHYAQLRLISLFFFFFITLESSTWSSRDIAGIKIRGLKKTASHNRHHPLDT
jgi:hypothetical protein